MQTKHFTSKWDAAVKKARKLATQTGEDYLVLTHCYGTDVVPRSAFAGESVVGMYVDVVKANGSISTTRVAARSL